MSFLPPKIQKEDSEEISDYINRLYEYYLQELKTEDFNYQGLFIYHNTEPDVENKDGGFWHIITKDFYKEDIGRVGANKRKPVDLPCKAENGMMVCDHICKKFHKYDPYRLNEVKYSDEKIADPRFICLNRCERISWIKALVKEAEVSPSKFKIWEKRSRNHQVNIHIWYEEEDFLIVLGRWKDETKYNMITSFVTNYTGKRRQCEKDFAKYIKNGNTPI